MGKYSNNGGFDSSRWIRDFKNKMIDENLNDPILKKLRTLPKGNLLPPLNTWWEAQPEDLLSAVYWSKGQLPPRDPKKFEQAYNDIVKQLHVKYPIPPEVLPKIDVDDETERALSVDAPGMNEAMGKKYEVGDMWSNDFDYIGMLKAGSQADYDDGLEYLQDLYASFEDVNYHSENKHLGYAIDEMENPGPDVSRAMEAIEGHLEDFNKACMDTLNDITRGLGSKMQIGN